MEIFCGRIFVRYFDYFCSENFSESLRKKIRIMNINEIVGRLKVGGLDASSTNRSAAVYVTEERSGRAEPGWFGFRIVCDSEATERRARAILSRWYDIDANGNVWRLRSKNRVPLMAIKRGGVPPTPPPDNLLRFTSNEDASTIRLTSGITPALEFETSRDGLEWQPYTLDDTITVDAGEKIFFRGENSKGFYDFINSTKFSMTGSFDASGDITCLINKSGGDVPLYNSQFANLFFNCAALKTAPDLPSTHLSTYCYMSMFSQCSGLTTAPKLPASVLPVGSYQAMFAQCSQLGSVTILATDISATNSIANWLNNVSPTGDIYCPAELTIPTGASGIPSGWTRHDI